MSSTRFIVLLICALHAVLVIGDHPTTPSSTTHPTQLPTNNSSTNEITSTPAPGTDAKTSSFPDNVISWTFKDVSTNLTCIKLKGAIQFVYNYPEASNKTFLVDIEKNTNYTISGTCGADNQTLNVTWPSSLNQTFNNSLLFTFGKIDNNTKISLHEVAAQLIVNDTSDFKAFKMEFKNFTEFNVPLNRSFKCKSKMNFSGQTANSTLWFANFQYEAFDLANSTEFANSESCPADSFFSGGGMSGWLLAFLIIVLILVVLGAGYGLFYYYKKIRTNTTYENM